MKRKSSPSRVKIEVDYKEEGGRKRKRGVEGRK